MKREMPSKRKYMKIKSVHIKGTKGILSNKRGLFLANTIKNLFERILKNRNKGNLKEGMKRF